MAVHSSVGKCYFFVLAFVTVVFVPSEGEYPNESLFTIIVVQFVSLQQLLTLLVRCTHQSMLSIVLVVLPVHMSHLRDPVPTVCTSMGHTTVHITPIVMVHHLDWLILNLDQSSTITVTIIFGIILM